MDIKKIVIVNAVFALLFSASCAETTRTTRRSTSTGRPAAGYPLPWIKKDCDICHLPPGAYKAGALKKKLSQLCLDCHRDRKAPAEHRVDMVPSMEVKGLPLFEGKVACPTCHDTHGNANGSMLRVPASDLCVICHPK
jgi:predicted CXXCH cytochrome family protein